jgi:hypothetical protein
MRFNQGFHWHQSALAADDYFPSSGEEGVISLLSIGGAHFIYIAPALKIS